MNGCELPIKTNDVFNVLRAELGSDVERFVQLHALTTDNGTYTDDFIEYCKTKYDIDIQFDSKENVDTIVTAIKDYALIKDFSVKYGSEMQNANDLSVRYGYTSDLARKEMFKFAVHRITNVLSNIQVDGKTFAQELGKDDAGNLKNPKKFLEQKVLKNIGENISAEFAKIGVNKDTIKELYRTGKLSELNELAIKHNGSKELKNLIAGLREMKDSDRNYFDEVFHSKELTQFKIKELAEVLSEVDNIRAEEEEQNPVPLTDEHDDDESKDDSYNVYENHLGTLSDASKHIPVDLKLYLNGVPRLNSNKRFNQDGSTPKDSDKADANKELLWDVKKNADTGLDEFVSYKEAQAILFSYINYSSKPRMIKSMKRIAATLPNGKFLYKIADDCEHNTDLRNKIFRNFKKNRIEKHQVVITDEGVSYNISNIESDRKSTLFYSLLTDINNNFKTAIQITGFNKVESNITNLFNIIQNNPTKDNTVIIDKYVDRISEQIYELTKQYFPTISQDSIRAFINQPDLFTQPYNIKHPFYQLYTILNSLNTDFEERRKVATRLEQERADAIKNNKEYNDWFEEATDPNFGDLSESEAEKIAEKTGRKLVKVPELESAITPDDKNNINKLTKLLLDFVPIYCPNNSKNSKGDQSSDHINDSWITYLNDVLSDKDSIERFGNDIFRSVQADYNTILVENKEIGNKGLFKLENGKYVPTAYAEDFMHFSLFDGVNNRTSGEGAGHSDLGAIDQDVTSLHAYFNPKLGVDEQYGSTRNIKYARYFLRVPADATNTFDISLPRYDIDGLLSKGVVNRNHTIFKQYKNAAIQILTNAMHVAKVCCDADPTDSTKISKVVKPGTEAKCRDTKYFMNGSTFFDKNGNPTGNVFKSNIFSFNTIDSDGNKIPVKDFDERLMSIASFFYDGVNDNVFKLDGNSSKTKIAFTKEQNDKLEDLVSEFIIAYGDSGVAKFKNNNLSEYINLTDAEVQEYTLNYKLVYCNLDFLLEGSQGFYGDVAKFLKRAKEVQGSGTAQAAYDSTADSKYTDTEVLDIDMTVTKGGTKYSYNKTKFRKAYDALKKDKALSAEKIKEEANRIASRIEMKPTFKAVTIRNSEITEEGCIIGKTPEEDGYLVQAIRENMKEEIGEANAIELSRRIMGQYADAKANDAQSYITFEEFIRRLAQKGQLNENKPLIEKILNEDEPIDVNDLVSFVQVLKNFYFDQHFDEEFQMYTPRQIKNSEFILIPRFIKGTELEVVHDLMEKYGIDQVNTIETSKAFNSNILELWDKDGNLPAERNEKGEIVVKPFEDALALNKYAIQEYSYQFMYTQQEGVQHINANNKLGLQIAKKILDNIKDSDPRFADKQDFIKCLVANIQDSFEELQKELEYTVINKKTYININNFLEKFKRQADTLGLDTASYDYLTLENEVSDLLFLGNVPLTKMPMELSAFSVKLEQIANALFNTMVTRQTLPGFHGAQVTGIGFKELGTKDSIKKDKNLQYHPKLYTNAEGKTITQREYDKLDDADKQNYKYSGIADYIEIRIPKSIYPIKVTDENGNERSEEDLLNELRSLGIDEIVGYRIPSESKHSIAKMKIVGFLDPSQGTTIVVPTGWVPQTGSDFDIDSIYGITYDVSLRNGKLYKETLVKELTDDIYANYIAKKLKIHSDKDYNNLDEIRKQNPNNVKYSEFTNRNALLKSYIDAEKSRVFAIKKDNVANTYTFIDGEAKDFLNKLKAQHTITTSSEKKDLHTAQINLLNKLIATKEGLLKTQKADPKLAKEADATASRLNNLKKYKDALVQLYAPISVNIKAIKTEHKEELRQTLNEDYKRIGKEKGFLLDDFKSEFEKHPERYNTRIARNNEMVKAISNIIGHPKSWEEMFSPSGFADIMEGIAEYSDPRVKQANDNRTPYDIWDQCELHGEVVSGKKLKGISVMSDTATSVFSQTKAKIRTNVTVIPKGSNEEQVSNKLGWIDENFRNFAGRIQTDYVSQTTCHQLDVLKAGAVRNVTEDTFNQYKIFVMLGFTYDTAISFISQPAIEKLVNTISKTKSIYSDDYGSDALFKTLLSTIKDYATVDGDIDLYNSIDSCSNVDEIITAISKTRGSFKDYLEELHDMPSALIAEDDVFVNSNMYSQRIKNDDESIIPLDDRIRNYCFGSDRFYNEIEVDDDSVVEVFISSNEGITSGKVLANKKVNNGEIVTNDYSKSKKAYGIFCSDAKTKQMHISTQAIVNNIVKLCEEAVANPTKTFKVNLSSTSNEEAFGLTGQDLANMFIMAGAKCSIKEIPSNIQFSKTWEKGNVFNKNNNIDASIFDIGVLITYKKIKDISDKVMAVAKHLRYDKEGAKQSIYETKQLEDDLDDLINAEEPFVLAEDGRNLLTAIYRTSLEDSVYPQLKAFHDYCTIPSIDINGSIFVTAKDKFDVIINSYTDMLRATEDGENPELNPEERKKVTKYLIGQVLASTVKDKVIDISGEKPVFKEIEGISKIVAERDRMEGINYTADILFNGDEIVIDDMLNPSEEQIEAFSNLSPAQKVLWLQKNISDAGIFDKINVVLSNQAQTKRLGYSKHNIYINTNDVNVDDLRLEFNLAYYSKSPIVKLAALDLIKYAVEIEQYDYDTNGIYSIIPNDCLIELGIIDQYRQNYYHTDYHALLESYVNKHYKDIYKIYQYVDRANKYNIESNFGLIIAKRNDKIIKDITHVGEKNKTFIDKYVKIKRYKNRIAEVTLYKTVEKGPNVFLIPINPIEGVDADDLNPKRKPKFLSEYVYNSIGDYILEANANANTPVYIMNKEKLRKEFGDAVKIKFDNKIPLAMAKPFDINNPPIKFENGFEQIVNAVNLHFNRTSNPLYVRNVALSNYITNYHGLAGSVQVINGREYYITRQPVAYDNRDYIVNPDTGKPTGVTLTKTAQKKLDRHPFKNLILESIQNNIKLDNVFIIRPFEGKLKETIEKGWTNLSKNRVKSFKEIDVKPTGKLDNAENFNSVKETNAIMSSEKTILSNSELKLWNKEGIAEKPRILVASEHTDPVVHVNKLLDIIDGKESVNDFLGRQFTGHDFAGLYLITKHDGLPMRRLLETKIPKLIHFSITGLGGTTLEPGVMKPDDMLDRIKEYLDMGLDPNCVTIRIDPIVPGKTTKEMIENIIKRSSEMGLKRIKFSIMDMYDNTRKALLEQVPDYNINGYYESKEGTNKFHAKREVIEEYYDMLLELKDKYKVELHTCAEPISRKGIEVDGCLSVKAVNQMLGINLEDKGKDNNTQRKECSCFGGKVDALRYNNNCASHCVYCYAKHENDTAMRYYNEDGSLKINDFTVTRENAKVEATSDFEDLEKVTSDTQTEVEQEKNTITISKTVQVHTDLAYKRKGLSSNTYLDAIKNKEITIHLIEHNKENIDFWKDTKIGNVIEFTDGHEKILIKVTDLINKVDKDSVSLRKQQFHDIKDLSQGTGYTQKFIKEEIIPNNFSAVKFEYISKVDDVDSISTVTPTEMEDMYSDIIEEDTINTEGLDPLTKFAVRSVEIIKLHSIKENNNINYGTYQKVKEYKATNSTDFSKYPTKEIIAVTRNYLEQKYSELETKLAVFSEINGTPIPMNSEAAMEIIKNDAAERNRFEHILLEASALRHQYEIIDNIALTADDYDLNEDLTKIKNVIGKLKSDTELKLTWKRYFEEYVISLSTDPRIKDNMLNLFENFYNTNRARYLFENVQENHTPIVQIIIKAVMDDTRANELATNKEVVDFNKTVNEIEQEAFAAGTPVNYDKIINEQGIRIREYKPEFVDALSELSDKVNEIAITEGKDSIAYHKAANELLKFKHDNIEQALISDYYKELATINDNILNIHPDIFVEYKRIVRKLAEFNTMEVDGELTTALEIEKTKVLDEFKELLSEGEYNPSAGGRVQKPSMYDTSDKINNIDAVNALKEYIEKNKAIREKYFENNPKLGWTEKLLKNLQIVEDYELRFGGAIPISHLERYPEYNKAKRWIRNNATYTGDSEEREKLNNAYNVLRRGNDVSGRETFNNLVKQKKARDYQGIVDGRVFNDEEIKTIKEAQEKRFNIAEGVPYNEDTLLSNSPKAKDVFTKEFYKGLTIPGTTNSAYIKIVKEINDILIKYRNPVNGEINTSSISIEDLKALKPLYRKIIYTPNENGFDPDYITKKTANEEDIAVVTQFINENCEAIVNEASYKKHYDIARSKGLEYFSAWLDTNLVYDSRLMSYAINPRLYGTLVPLNYEHGVPNEFVDTERTEAVNTIKSLSRSEPTQYYFETRREKREALSEEDYNEWIKRNHIYNPITGELEPIDCWMHTVILSENPEDKYNSAKYEPTKNNLDSIPRAFAVNPNYDLDIKNPYANYKKYDKTRNKFYDVNYDNEEYDTLTPQELKIKNLFDNIIESKAVTRAAKRHFAKGYMPAEYKAKEYNLKEFAKDAGETLGIKIHNSGNDPYDYNVGYESSYIRQLPMAAILENANSVKPNYAKPKREHYATEKEYNKAMTEFKNKLAEDEKINLEIHSQLINKNWRNAMSNFIRKANDFKTIKNNEGLLYMGQQFLEQLNTYKLLSGRDKLMKADKFGTTNEEKYAKEKRNYVLDEFNVFLNRYINKQYREPNGKLTRFADSLQTFTSAMYMSGNVLGGVANVTVGNVNILMEAVAGEYIGAKTWTKGRITYDKGVPYYLKDMYSDKASSLESALIKLFDIVDFDQFNGVVDSNNVSKFLEKARDVQYAPQHLGEHRMQNSVLFGLMESHRLYTETDSNGKIKVVAKTLDTVKRDVEETALKAILSEKDLHKYELFKKYIKEDANKYKDYVTFDKNFVTEFINNDYISIKQRKEFIKKKEELEKSIEKEFNDDAAHPTLFSQFEFKEGYASLKEDSVLGGLSAEESNKLLGAFKNKVILVNDRIHGSYDKLGGGAIETTKWYGRLVTQYHKHLYPGIMKHYRTQGYYNEVRETVEKGGLSSTIAYLNMPFRSAKFRKEIEADLQAKGVTGYEELLDFAEINQNVLKRALSLYTNIVLNWKIMSETDRNNIRRMTAELVGPAIAIAATVGIKLTWDDDDNRDDSLAYNFFIHELDRFSTECIMYNPLGIVAEGKKLWSSPIAAQSALGGIINICGYTAQYLTNDDFNWVFKTGSHAGEHKLLSQIERRIPLYHSYYNITRLQKNNRFFKLEKNYLGIGLADPIVEFIKR